MDNRTDRIYQIERDSHTQSILADYALLDVLPSPAPGHRILLFAGLSTTGTQGAATFATSPEGLRQVTKLLGAPQTGDGSLPAYFECLLRVGAVNGLDALKVNVVSCSSF